MATILVVDDRPSNRQFLVTLLGYGGHRLLEATDGAEALRVARAEQPDLIITDILMPTMDGLELVRQLRAEPPLASVPVMFYSATYLQQEARALARTVGVTYVLAKPAEPQAILEVVNAALGLGEVSMPPVPTRSLGEALPVVSAKLSAKTGELDTISSRLAALVNLGLDLTLVREPERLLEKFCGAARHILGAQYAALVVLEDDLRTLRHFFTSGLDPESVARLGPPPTGQGLLGRVLAERGPVRVRDISAPPQALGFPPHHPHVRTFLGVPIASSAQMYGLLYLTDKLGADEFNEADAGIAVTVAAQVAVAYENARLYDEIQRHAAQLQLEVIERKRAEAELAASEKRFRALIEHSADGIALIEADGTILYTTPAYARILGYAIEELVGRNGFELIHPEDVPYATEVVGQLLQQPGSTLHAEVRERHKDGTWRWLEGSVKNLLAEPSVKAIVANLRDVSERKRAEETLAARNEEIKAMSQQLWQAAKLATMGELAASIAHELNNPLQTVSLRVETLLAELPAEDARRRSLHIAEQELERMAALVANLLHFSRRSPQQTSTLDVRDEIEKTLELVHHQLRRNRITVARDFAPDAPLIQADRQHLRQLLLNLFTNASDAMPDGGTLTIRVSAPGRAVVVEVADTGVGISPDDLPRVEEPFFTTKPEGRGTGLGLGICRRVMQEHGGTFDIASAGLGHGTTVRATFPVGAGAPND